MWQVHRFIHTVQTSPHLDSDLASDAFPAILNNLSPPDIVTDIAKISKLHISNVAKPNISAKFIGGKGVAYEISLASFRASAFAEISVFVFSYVGDFTAELRELSIESQLHFDHNGTTTVTVIRIVFRMYHQISGSRLQRDPLRTIPCVPSRIQFIVPPEWNKIGCMFLKSHSELYSFLRSCQLSAMPSAILQ